MKLSEIAKYEAEAKRLGVSMVARSSRGFLTAFKRAKGDPSKLSEYWKKKREAFIKRHMAQAQKNGEKLYDARTGKYSRRGIAMIMWSMDPK